MLEILSLVACGWLLMYNPPDKPESRPITEWHQLKGFDTASDCENHLVGLWQDAEKEKRTFPHVRLKCIPVDIIYSQTQPNK